jgi:hypothetical protein
MVCCLYTQVTLDCHSTRLHIAKYMIRHQHRCENLQSFRTLFCVSRGEICVFKVQFSVQQKTSELCAWRLSSLLI